MRKSDLGDIVVLDADTNSLETPFNDVDSLPHDVVSNTTINASFQNNH